MTNTKVALKGRMSSYKCGSDKMWVSRGMASFNLNVELDGSE